MPTYIENTTLYPDRIIAGDAIDIDITLSDYPATAYTLSYALVNATHQIEWTAGAVGDDYNLAVASAVTAAYVAGTYSVQVYMTDVGGERVTIFEGSIEIANDFSAAAVDARQHPYIVRENLRACIEGTVSLDQTAYSIAGRSLSRRSLDELRKLLVFYEAWCLRLDRAAAIRAGKAHGNQIKTHFRES